MDENVSTDRWEHSALESLVLLNGPITSELAAARMAIVELVVRHALIMTTVGRKFLRIFSRQTSLLGPGPAIGQQYPEPLKEVISRYRALEQKHYSAGVTGVTVRDLARSIFGAARRRSLIGRILRKRPAETNGFVETVMLPHLAKRGWFRRGNVTFGSFYRTSDWEITPAGLAELERLRQIVQAGTDSFPRWVQEEPERAERFVDLAGPALLLIPGIAPHIRTLSARASAPGVPQAPAHRNDRERQPLGDSMLPPVAAGAFSLIALAGVFGPGEFDGFDSTMYAVSEDASLEWELIVEGGGGDGG